MILSWLDRSRFLLEPILHFFFFKENCERVFGWGFSFGGLGQSCRCTIQHSSIFCVKDSFQTTILSFRVFRPCNHVLNYFLSFRSRMLRRVCVVHRTCVKSSAPVFIKCGSWPRSIARQMNHIILQMCINLEIMDQRTGSIGGLVCFAFALPTHGSYVLIYTLHQKSNLWFNWISETISVNFLILNPLQQ